MRLQSWDCSSSPTHTPWGVVLHTPLAGLCTPTAPWGGCFCGAPAPLTRSTLPAMLQVTSAACVPQLPSQKEISTWLTQSGFLKKKNLKNQAVRAWKQTFKTDRHRCPKGLTCHLWTTLPPRGGARRGLPPRQSGRGVRLLGGPWARSADRIKSYRGPVEAKEKHLLGYWEVPGSTAKGAELRRVTIACARRLCRMENCVNSVLH